ncbi:MAG: PD40 domain-containing protein [Anaerolineales bacterium]|nr:PD40 domain-containing protein [Anaerolineales bacterium]
MAENVHGAATQARKSAAPQLEITQGENRGDKFKLKFDTKLGRERDNDIVLLDAKVSRYHAQISLDAGQWVLTDLSSANGTIINGIAIAGPVALQSGDLLRVGETELKFTFPGQPEAAAVPSPQMVAEPAVAAAMPASAPQPGAAAPAAGRTAPPRLAWIAGGLILLVCFAAVLVIYLVSNRFSDGEAAVAEGTVPAEGTSADAGEQANDQPVAPDGAPEQLALVYEDDFSDSFGGWDDAFDTYTRKVYGNNRYQIEVNASNLVAWGLANRDVADFEMEVEAKLEDGDQKNSYGLLLRFQDRDNFYRFDISGDGYFLLSKFVDGEWSTLVDWTESEFISTDGSANILKIAAFGPEIRVWANGQELASVRDDSLTHGNFGFFAGTFAEPYVWVSFDNLKLWTPQGNELTLIPTATRPGVAVAVAGGATPLPTPSPISTINTPTPASDVSEAAEIALAEGGNDSPIPTPTLTTAEEATSEPTSEATSEPTATPVPLPEYASRDQTLARGEAKAIGRIVFPIYDPERSTYDIYMANIADGSGLTLIQPDASQPALTTDGTDIAYRSWQADRRGLFARSLDEKDTDAWGFDLFFESARPQFSPVDNNLMYHSRKSGREPAIYELVNGVGEVMRQEGFPVQGKSPKWSPDGQQFVYSSCIGGNCGIVLNTIVGGGPKLITDHPSDTNPEISPDGSTVVFMSERGGNWEIYRVDISGDNLAALTSDSSSDGLPTWSPDGAKIAFVSNRDAEWAIWDMNPDGTDKRRHFALDGSVDGIVQHDRANSLGWVEENIDWIP